MKAKLVAGYAGFKKPQFWTLKNSTQLNSFYNNGDTDTFRFHPQIQILNHHVYWPRAQTSVIIEAETDKT